MSAVRLPMVNGRKYWWDMVVRETPPVRWQVGKRGSLFTDTPGPACRKGLADTMGDASREIERIVAEWETL